MPPKKKTPPKNKSQEHEPRKPAIPPAPSPSPIQTIEEFGFTSLEIDGVQTKVELDPEDLLILKEYFSNGMNGTRAWMETHPDSQYDSASVSFTRWLGKAKIAPVIEHIRKQLAMDVFEAVARMGAIARGNIGNFLKRGADGFMYLDLSNPEALNNMHLVEQIETKRERRIVGYGEEAEEFEGEWVKVKLYSSPAALRDILKMHGKLTTRMEVTGKDGAPLVPPIDADGYKQSIDALADTLREVLSGTSPGTESKVGSEK